METRADHFPLFDSLRGIAALCVVVAHVGFFGNLFQLDSPLKQYTARLEIGVAMFFLISSFLIYRPFAAARLRNKPPMRLRAYGWRRALRLFPGYWVALTLVTVWLGSGYIFSYDPITPTFSAEGILAYYGLSQLYFDNTLGGGLPQAWTLSVEASFYLFVPAWAWLMRRIPSGSGPWLFRSEMLALAALAVASLAYKLLIVEGGVVSELGTTPTPLLSSLPAYFDMFAAGMMLAVLSIRVQDEPVRRRFLEILERWPAVPWLLAALLFWIFSTRLGFTGEPSETMSPETYFARHFLLLTIAGALLLPAVFGDPSRGLVRRLLASRPLLFIGLVSYGIYGYHLAIIIQLLRLGWDGSLLGSPWIGWLVATVPASVAIGAISYYVIERPVLKLKRLIPGDRREAPDQPGAVSVPAKPPTI